MVWLVVFCKKKFKQKDCLNIQNTDIVVFYYNLVTYTVESICIVVSYNGNIFPTGSYLLRIDNRNTRPRCEICSKLTLKIPE